jgi:uncharacterized protein (TIGR03067 family)
MAIVTKATDKPVRGTPAAVLLATGFALVWALVPGGRSAAEPPRENPAASELKALQGVWTLEAVETDGVRPDPSTARVWVLVIDKNIYNPGTRDREIEYTIRLDPSHDPKWIDLIPHAGPNKLRTLRGIYRTRGDLLTICRSLDPDDPRPTAFATGPGTGRSLVVWKRKRQ